MDKKNLFLWSLYDFANSIVYISFLLYFAQWLVIDAGLSDLWYNGLFAIATVFLLFSAPVMAARVDKHGGGKSFLNFATIATLVGYGGATFFAYLGIAYLVPAAASFLIGQYFYQLSFVFYTPMLVQIATPEYRARASGIGQFANALGQISGVLIALPFAASRTGPLIPSLVLFCILALPMMLFFKERRTAIGNLVGTLEHQGFFKRLFRFLAVSAGAPLLVAYFFFNDAIITLSNNYAIVLERIFAASDTQKSFLLLSILIMSALGGILAGWIVEKTSTRKTLIGLIVGWVVMLPVLAAAPTFAIFSGLTALVGLLIGSSYSTARVYMSELLAPEEMTYGFSLFTLFERFASIVGPLAWGGTIALLSAKAVGYRVAIVVMGGLILVGLLVLVFWKREKSSGGSAHISAIHRHKRATIVS